jgi:hypothetical protein
MSLDPPREERDGEPLARQYAVFYLHTESRGIVDDVSQSVFNLKNASLTANIIEEAIVIHGFPGEWFATIAAYSAQVHIYTCIPPVGV